MRLFLSFCIMAVLACSTATVKLFDTPEDQFEYARMLYDKGKYTLAAEAFQTVIFRFHGTSLADSVAFYSGMCYYNLKDYIVAIPEFQRLLVNYPSSPLADQAHYLIAKCYFLDAPHDIGLEQDGVDKAITEIENFFEDFPNSGYRQNASDLLDSCYARLAKKDYRNGEVYYKIGDYRAARIYFENVVIKYSLPEWVGKSLYRLAEIDCKEKHYEDARAKLENLINKFPQHEWLAKAKAKLAEVEQKAAELSANKNEKTQD